jgi:hypothetical protein
MRIKGHVDLCDATRVVGWVFCPEAPETKFSLSIIAGGETIGTTHAGHHRADLERAGMGDGYHAFIFDMPPLLSDEQLRDIRVQVLGSDVLLLPGPADAQTGGAFRTRFGGLWIDRTDWIDVLGDKHRRGMITDATAEQITRLVRDGFTVLRGAVPQILLDELAAQTEADLPENGGILADPYRTSTAARRIAMPPASRDLIRVLLDAPPLLFAQTLTQSAPGARMRKDSVLTPIPGNFLTQLATWAALEPIAPGCGELAMLVGSHHAPQYLFGGRHRMLAGHEDEAPQFEYHIAQTAADFGYRRFTFTANPGDMLIRHADLAYADTPVVRSGSSRRALISHITRASLQPMYRGESQHAVLETEDCSYVSQRGDVV